MSRSVLLITDAYPPEIRSSAILMHELAEGLQEAGLAVSVLTTFPRYNLTDEARDTYRSVRGNVTTTEKGVTVYRVPTLPIHHVGPLRKGIGQLALVPTLLAFALTIPRPDVILVYSPPLPLGLLGGLIGALRRSQTIVNVQDLFPQNAIDLGVLRGRLAIAFWRAVESWVYRLSTRIACHSAGNRGILQAHPQAGTTKVVEVHNWVDLDVFARTAPDDSFKATLGIPPNARVVLFGGVLGYAQDIPTIVEAASRLPQSQQVVVLIVGDGVQRRLVESAAKECPTLFFHPFVDPDTFRSWLKASDIGLVTLDAKMRTPVVPSKLLNFMAAERPVIAALNPESDGIPIVQQANCGLVVPPSSPQELADAIVDLGTTSSSRLLTLGQAGRQYATEHFSRETCIQQYVSLIHEIAQ